MQLLPLLFIVQVVAIFLTVLADCISLPFVRRFLSLAQTYPLRASTIASVVGFVVVAISYCVFLILALVATLVPYVSEFKLDSFSM
jgi:hypothetical protein